jgi:hypothetical protein
MRRVRSSPKIPCSHRSFMVGGSSQSLHGAEHIARIHKLGSTPQRGVARGEPAGLRSILHELGMWFSSSSKSRWQLTKLSSLSDASFVIDFGSVRSCTQPSSRITCGASTSHADAIRGHSEVTPRALRGHSEVTPRSLRGHSEVTPRSLRGQSNGTPRALRGHSEVTPRSLRGHSEVTPRSIRGHQRSLRGHFEVTPRRWLPGARAARQSPRAAS